MKIDFRDKSYIRVAKTASGKIEITIMAKDETNNLKKIINSIEISMDEFKHLISDVV